MLRASAYKSETQRLPIYTDYGVSVISFGEQNIYPNYSLQLALSSGNLQKALKMFRKFAFGAGFANMQFANSVVNAGHNNTANKVLRACVHDYTVFNGFALHVNYNALGQVKTVQHVPFHFCRKGTEQEEGKIAVWNNWFYESYYPTSFADIVFLDEFNPDKDVVFAQIKACGGIEHYNGQILYACNTADIYPLTTFDSVMEIVESDVRAKNYMRNNIKNGFSANKILEYPGEFQDENERANFMQTINEARGDENAGAVMVIENPMAFEKPLVMHDVTNTKGDALFTTTAKEIRDAIRSNYLIPSVLLSEAEAGLFNQEQMSDAYKFYNNVTNDDRIFLSEGFKSVFSAFWVDNNLENDFSIKPLALLSDEKAQTQKAPATKEIKEDQPVQNTLRTTVGGITGIIEIKRSVYEGVSSLESAITLLQEMFDFDEATARKILT